jgi:hypothetical protein
MQAIAFYFLLISMKKNAVPMKKTQFVRNMVLILGVAVSIAAALDTYHSKQAQKGVADIRLSVSP